MQIPSVNRVLILGKGVSGMGAADALKAANIDFELTDETDFDEKINGDFDLIVVSPSVTLNHRAFAVAAKLGIEIIGELELGFRLCDKPIVAVTGTNGKTTTTELIAQMLKSRYAACATGNIGRSFSKDATKKYDVYAVEVSSFQLETVSKFRPNIAVITNITPDHLDRHGNMKEYARLKLSIAKNQKADDYLILSADGIALELMEDFAPDCNVIYTSLNGRVHGAYVLNDKIFWLDEFVCFVNRIKMQGIHNVANALSAIAAAKLCGVETNEIVKVLGRFDTDAHRMKYVASVNGVAFYNDSKGTNIDAVDKAMQSMPSSFCLIAGGSDKGYEFDGLFDKNNRNLLKVCAIGETANKIAEAAKRNDFKNVEICESLKAAVISAYRSGAENVLLSPGTASFDMFANYAARGEEFERIVHGIKDSENGRN